MDTRQNPAAEAPKGGAERTVIPVVRETVQVDKRAVETGKVTVEVVPKVRTEVVEVPLVDEQAVVERVPVNRVVERTEPARQEGDTTIIPVYEEVLVVERRLILKEEVRIRREKRAREEKQEIELRSEEARVSREDTASDAS
jgi:uncharacterized protein (TIGR02271 family)